MTAVAGAKRVWLRITAKIRHRIVRKRPLSEAPDLMQHQFLFLCGLHRSGTSILHRILGQSDNASGFFGTGVPEDEGQHLQSVFKPALAYGGPGRFAFDARSHLDETSQLVNDTNRDLLLREWGAYYDLRKRLLLEKSPPNIVRSRFLQAMVPNSRFVFIVRHPIAVSLATRKWSKNPIVELMRHWYLCHTIMLNDLVHINDSLVLRYEDLVQDPTATLEMLFAFAGIKPCQPSERIVDCNGSYFSSWKKDGERDGMSLNSQFPELGELAARFGYAMSEPYVKRFSGLKR